MADLKEQVLPNVFDEGTVAPSEALFSDPENDVALFDAMAAPSKQPSDSTRTTAALAALAVVGQGRGTIEELEQKVQENHALILDGREPEIRERISYDKQQRQAQAFDELTGVYGTFDYVTGTDTNALEKEGVNTLYDMGMEDQTQADISEWTPEVGDVVRDRQSKVAILQKRIDDLEQVYLDSGNTVGSINATVDTLLGWMPFIQTATASKLGKKATASMFNPGASRQEKRDYLFNLPIDQFEAEVDGWVANLNESGVLNNPKVMADILKESIEGIDVTSENIRVGLGDVAGAAGSLFEAGMGVRALLTANKNPIKFMAPVNRNLASTIAVQTAQGASPASDVIQTYHAIDVMLPSQAPTLDSLSVGLSGDILRKLNNQQQLSMEALSLRQMGGRLSEEELATAVEKTSKQIASLYNPNQIMDTKVLGVDNLTGMNTMEVQFGKANGTGGWSTEDAALKGASRLKLLGAKPFQDSSGQWFVKQVHNIKEEGVVSAYDVGDIGTSFLNPVLTPSSFIPGELASAQNVAGARLLKLNSVINKELLKPLAGLGGASKKKLSTMLEMSHKNEAWLTPTQFDTEWERVAGKLPSPKEKLAYYTAKQLNDFDWLTRNRSIYTTRARQGYLNAEIGKLGFKGNAKPLSLLEQVESIKMYDITSGKYRNGMTADEWTKLQGEGYQAFYIDEGATTLPKVEGEHINVVLGKKGEFKTGPLAWEQLGYVAGGHRIYPTGSLFLKQARIYTRADGSAYQLDPMTHGITLSAKDGKLWVNDMEELRQFVKANRKELDANTLTVAQRQEFQKLTAKTQIADYDHWKALRDDGALMEDTPFELVRDGELPAASTKSTGSFLGKEDVVIDDSTKFMLNRNKRYTGKRGDLLLGPDEMDAKVLDPFEAMSMSVTNAVKTGAYYDYRVTQQDKWFETFKSQLENKTASDALFNPKWKNSTSSELVGKANDLRNNIVRQLGVRTFESKAQDDLISRMAEVVEDKIGTKYQSNYEFFNKDFAGAWKRWTSRAYMGFFNPGQFLLQAQTAVAATTISPRAGLASWARLPQMRAALYADEAQVNRIAENFFKSPKGFGKDNFKQLMKSAQDSGFLQVGDEGFRFSQEVPLGIGKAKSAFVSDTFNKGGRLIDQIGNIPLRETERWNRMIAYSIAYEEQLRKVGGTGLLKLNPKIEKEMLDRASTLSFDMYAAGRSALSSGVPGVIGQFKQYGINYSQAMGLLPGSKLSQAERIRMAAGAIMLYGGAGIPLGRQAVDYAVTTYQETNKTQLDPAAIKTMQTGMLDGMLDWITEGELKTSFGSRAGIGGAWDSFFKLAAEGSIVEAIGGPGAALNTGLVSDVYRSMKFIGDSVGEGSLTGEDLKVVGYDLARNIKTFSDVEKAWVLKQGLLLSRNGMRLGEGEEYGTPEGIASILGIPLSPEVDTWVMYKSLKSDEEDVKMVSRMMVENSLRASKDPEAEESYAKLNRFLLEGTDFEFRDNVIKEYSKGLGGSPFYDNMIERSLERSEFDSNVSTYKSNIKPEEVAK